MTVAPVHIDDGLTRARLGGGWALSGRATRVPWGARAEHVVVVADGGAAPMIALVAGGHAKTEADLKGAYETLTTQFVAETKRTEVTAFGAALALVLLVLAIGLCVAW